jgi:pyrimidine oxygenase
MAGQDAACFRNALKGQQMNRLDFGLFLPSTSGNLVFGERCLPNDLPSFALNRQITRMAEDAGLDYALCQAKWRGFGGPSRHWDHSLEAFSLISALAASTQRIRLYASVAIRTMHPVVVAKMAATIDDVSQGRFGVNIVSGWNKVEYEQMGLWDEDAYYRYRYAYAEEYIAVLNKIWSEDAASFDGRFFKLNDCQSYPKPARPLPIVCAGQSPDAIAFISKYADYAFVGRMDDDAKGLGRLSAAIDGAAATHNRSVGSYVLMSVVADETDATAFARRDQYVEHADTVAIQNWASLQGKDPHKAAVDQSGRPPLQKAFMGIHLNAGSYQTVAEHIDALAEQGVRGVCLGFPDFAPDLAAFIAHVLPRCRSFQPLFRPAEPAPT